MTYSADSRNPAKAFLAVILLAVFLQPSSTNAQISIRGEDGSTVNIGPDGINVITGQDRVRLTPGSIDISTPGHNTERRIDTTKPVKNSFTRHTTRKSSSTNPAFGDHDRVATEVVLSLQDKLEKLEIAAYGKLNDSKPLIARIEKLEIDNTGKKGTGSNMERLDALAGILGVRFNPVSTALQNNIVNSSSSITNVESNTIVSSTNNGTSSTIRIETRDSGDSSSPLRQKAVSSGKIVTLNEDLTIQDNHRSGTFDCQNHKVTIYGNHGNISLKGTCRELVVYGSHNRISAERLDQLTVMGRNNEMSWSKAPAPKVSITGKNNNASGPGNP